MAGDQSLGQAWAGDGCDFDYTGWGDEDYQAEIASLEAYIAELEARAGCGGDVDLARDFYGMWELLSANTAKALIAIATDVGLDIGREDEVRVMGPAIAADRIREAIPKEGQDAAETPCYHQPGDAVVGSGGGWVALEGVEHCLTVISTLSEVLDVSGHAASKDIRPAAQQIVDAVRDLQVQHVEKAILVGSLDERVDALRVAVERLDRLFGIALRALWGATQVASGRPSPGEMPDDLLVGDVERELLRQIAALKDKIAWAEDAIVRAYRAAGEDITSGDLCLENEWLSLPEAINDMRRRLKG